MDSSGIGANTQKGTIDNTIGLFSYSISPKKLRKKGVKCYNGFYMVIQKLDDYFFKITSGDLTIGINPISKESKKKETRFGADIALIQARHPDFSGSELMEYKGKDLVTVKGPGGYEIQDVFIKGYRVPTKYDSSITHCTLYSVNLEGANLVFCGPIFDKEIPEEAAEELYQADIIFVPVNGDNVMEAAEAATFAKKFSPKYVVPLTGEKTAADAFFSSFGQDPVYEDKLTLRSKDFMTETTKVIALKQA